MNFQKFLNYALVFLLVLLAVQWFFPKNAAPTGKTDDLVITAPKSFTIGAPVILTLGNNTKESLTLKSDCPNEPFEVRQYENGTWQSITATADTGRCDNNPIMIPTGASTQISYQPWQRTLFVNPGKYQIEIPVVIQGKAKNFEYEFEIEQRGFLGLIWEEVVYRPIYNSLIFLTTIGGHSFGWGIVLLTLLIRIVLFFPFHRSMVSQRKMQAIQPEIDRIKEQYSENQQLLAQETMALFKKHNVSPFSSCLPILIQIPFLFALFWIVQGGLGENNFVLLYSQLANFSPSSISTHFFGLDLTIPDPLYLLPVIVGLLQFVQMKLALKRQPQQSTGNKNPIAEAMQMTSKYMPYFLPVLVVIGGVALPAAVAVYWGTSTLFGIGQQLIVNKLVK